MPKEEEGKFITREELLQALADLKKISFAIRQRIKNLEEKVEEGFKNISQQ